MKCLLATPLLVVTLSTIVDTTAHAQTAFDVGMAQAATGSGPYYRPYAYPSVAIQNNNLGYQQFNSYQPYTTYRPAITPPPFYMPRIQAPVVRYPYYSPRW